LAENRSLDRTIGSGLACCGNFILFSVFFQCQKSDPVFFLLSELCNVVSSESELVSQSGNGLEGDWLRIGLWIAPLVLDWPVVAILLFASVV